MQPLQVTFFLAEPMVLSDHSARLLTFDDLLAAAKYQETGDLRAGDTLPLARLTHPNGQSVYHASTWRALNTLQIEPMTIYKRTSAIALEHFQLAKSWDRGRGMTKDYELTYHQFYTPAIRFYCVGDPDEVNRLAQRLSFIGKKRALRKGQIWKCDVAPATHDRSLLDGGYVTRPIPVYLAGGWGGVRHYAGYKSPYWHPDNHTLCVVPPIGPLIEEEEHAHVSTS